MPRTEVTRAIREIVRTTDLKYADLAVEASCSTENVRQACEDYGRDMSVDVLEEISHYLTARGEKRHLRALDKSPTPEERVNGTVDDEIGEIVETLGLLRTALNDGSPDLSTARAATAKLGDLVRRTCAECDHIENQT